MSLFFQSSYNARTQTVYGVNIEFLALNLSKLIVLFSATNNFSEKKSCILRERIDNASVAFLKFVSIHASVYRKRYNCVPSNARALARTVGPTKLFRALPVVHTCKSFQYKNIYITILRKWYFNFSNMYFVLRHVAPFLCGCAEKLF